MIDINFYQKIYHIKQELNLIHSHKFTLYDLIKDNNWGNYIFKYFNSCRSEFPVIYNIETTNKCNMLCKMCPRTKYMYRKIETMNLNTFKNIISQIHPWAKDEWHNWVDFVQINYKTDINIASENNFFMYIIPKVLTLHGFGDPLLDETIIDKIDICSKRDIPTYFSCNPSNINIPKLTELMYKGLNYLKFSVDSVDDNRIKKIRGKNCNYSKAIEDIIKLIEFTNNKYLKTEIIIAMIELDNKSKDEFEILKEKLKPYNLKYIYLKSKNSNWLSNKKIVNQSLHWNEFCQFPWSSLSIQCDGSIQLCPEIWNKDFQLGNVKNNSLFNIWNSEKYENIRNSHIYLNNLCKEKCQNTCDMRLIGKYI